MKSLISVTPREFKRHFGEVMNKPQNAITITAKELVKQLGL